MRRLRRHTFRVALVIGMVTGLAACSAQQDSPPSPVVFDIPDKPDATPWIAADGSFVAVAWGAGDGRQSDVFVSVSRDGGETFAAPVQVNDVPGEARLGGEMPPRVAVVRSDEAEFPEIAVLWTARRDRTDIKVARSRDGGATFEAPTTLEAPDAVGDRGWPSLAFDRQGGIHAIWLDHRGLAAMRAAGSGGHHQHGATDGVALAQRSGLFYASLAGEGSNERELTAGVCYCCKTALAAGSGDTLFAAWRHVYPGNLRDMAFTSSHDRGASFSSPVRISEDGWSLNGCPDDGPAIAVGADQRVHVVWPTVVDEGTPTGAIFYATTTDGRAFSPRVRVPTIGGPKPSHPQVVVDGRGRIFVAWDEIVGGRHVAAARELKPSADGGATFGEIITLSDDSGGTYPVLAATETDVLAAWTTGESPSRVRLRPLK